MSNLGARVLLGSMESGEGFSWLRALSVAAVLVFLIWLYTKVHKTVAWSVIPMGLMRRSSPSGASRMWG